MLRHYSAANRGAPSSTTASRAAAPAAARQSGAMPEARFATNMVNRYDGGAQSRNHAADQNNTLVTLETAKLSMTGLPPDQAEMNLDELQFAGALAQMSDDRREQFAQRANALRSAPDDRYAEMLSSLQKDVDGELRSIQADPVRRMNAVFDAPVGISMLGDDGQQQMAALSGQYAKMNAPGTTPAQREQAFAKAVDIKSRMQDQILQKSQDVHAARQKDWSESTARVNQILDDADRYSADTIQLPRNSDDPQWDTNTRKPAYAKTFPYQSVMEKLLSPDGYSQQERAVSTPRTLSPADRARDLLTFQQGMSDPDSDIHRRVAKLEQQALSTMAHPGTDLDAVSPPTTLSGVAGHPPGYDQNYVQNLADSYQGVLKDIDQQNRAMLREPIPGLADKILYGIGRFAADLSPIPGMDWFATQLLDAGFPDHGGLSAQEVGHIDMGAMLFGLLIGRREPEAGGELKPPVGGELKPPGGGNGKSPGNGRTEGHLNGSGQTQGPQTQAPTPQSTTILLPEGYARQPAGRLEADPDSPGIFRDSKFQAYIRANGQTWPVRYDTDNGTWRVYQPDNPTKYQYPVRLDAHGNWQVHGDTGIPGGAPPRIPAETRQKAEALSRDGWTPTNIARRLGISERTVRRIKRDANLPDILGLPLQSIAFRKEVIARVNAGTPPEQIAGDMHVQPETVEVIVEQYRRDGQVKLDSGGPLPAETRQKAEALSRDGWTVTAVARRLDISQPTAWRIRQNMNLPDILGLPLRSLQIRKNVIARLQAGTPP
ncbi:helix-turn-helix domain containing protein, partial [Paraburkholderia sediminicola]|uniref:helix-turn-helix domain-containing protein n=1 Tax=Paraburkholderia sediminicola TaxID=458836 RepID=UPI0038B6C2C5